MGNIEKEDHFRSVKYGSFKSLKNISEGSANAIHASSESNIFNTITIKLKKHRGNTIISDHSLYPSIPPTMSVTEKEDTLTLTFSPTITFSLPWALKEKSNKQIFI